jgi:hypothetical protein
MIEVANRRREADHKDFELEKAQNRSADLEKKLVLVDAKMKQ